VVRGALPNQDQPQDQNQPRQKGTIAKGERTPPPNWRCYTTVFVVGENIDEHGNWLGGRLPQCRVFQGLLPPREHHECPGYYPKYPGIRSDIPFEERKAMREAARDDWDDDQYDRTTPGEIIFNPDEVDSGVILEWMDEETWIANKRRRTGLAPGYDPPDFGPEED
jgi:hypothetical protein